MPTGTTPAPPGRRERLRQETLRELRVAALEELREHGGADLSLRSVARRMGMSAPGLYRYVDSREALLTLLIADSYDGLADHLRAALGVERVERDGAPAATAPPMIAGHDADVADRLRAVALAYRHWAVGHPNEFALLFGNPIPGYTAPADGPTTQAMQRVGLALATPLLEAWQQGRLRLNPALDAPELAAAMGPMAALGGDLPPAAYVTYLVVWGRLHGQVSLEVFGHHDWLFPEGCEALLCADVEALLGDLGMDSAATSGGTDRRGTGS